MNIDLSIKIIQPLSSRIKSHTGKLKQIKIIGSKMKRAIILTIVSVFLFISFSCKENGITPPEDKPGRRDYTWTVDTLKVPEGRSLPFRMWGANANDVWAVGLAYLNAYCIWHFDGISWKNYVPDKYIDPRGIWGTSRNNIWIGSTDGAFWHYDGFQWSKFQETNIPNYRPFVNQAIIGNRADNIYAVGFADSIAGKSYKAIIMHFNGNRWEMVNIPSIQQSFIRIYYDKITGNFLIYALEFDTTDEYIYMFDGKNLNQIYTSENHTLMMIGEKIYLQNKNKILRFNGNKFEPFLELSADKYVGNALGRNEKDFFTINVDGIGHYNGTDLITIFVKPNIEWAPAAGIVFEKDVFFIWDDPYDTFVVHGKLNN